MKIELSEEAVDALANAEHWTGGRIGLVSPRLEDEVLTELIRAGMIGGAGGLTRRGVIVGRRLLKSHGERP